MINIIKNSLTWFKINLIIMNLLKNPKKGGRPPREKTQLENKIFSLTPELEEKKRPEQGRERENKNPITGVKRTIQRPIQTSQNIELLCRLSSIHLTLFNEERVSTSRADRKEVPILMINPKVKPITPTRIIEGKSTFLKIIKGINFCSVEKRKKNFHAAVLIILKNQPWKGKTPSFIIILRITII